jgi:hypothetical protein
VRGTAWIVSEQFNVIAVDEGFMRLPYQEPDGVFGDIWRWLKYLGHEGD